jgi:hypothetical protein
MFQYSHTKFADNVHVGILLLQFCYTVELRKSPALKNGMRLKSETSLQLWKTSMLTRASLRLEKLFEK